MRGEVREGKGPPNHTLPNTRYRMVRLGSTGVREYGGTGVREYGSTGVPEYGNTGVPEHGRERASKCGRQRGGGRSTCVVFEPAVSLWNWNWWKLSWWKPSCEGAREVCGGGWLAAVMAVSVGGGRWTVSGGR